MSLFQTRVTLFRSAQKLSSWRTRQIFVTKLLFVIAPPTRAQIAFAVAEPDVNAAGHDCAEHSDE